MKVEIAESYGEAAIICYAGLDEVRVDHKEPKIDPEGQPLDEFDVLIALLNAAVAELTEVHPAPPVEDETQAQRKEREESNRKKYEDYLAKKRKEEEEAEELSAREGRKSEPAEEPERRIHRKKE